MKTQRSECHTDGIDLKIDSLLYPNNILKANFFTDEVKVRELSINLNTVTKIEINAFAANGLQSLKKLAITGTSLLTGLQLVKEFSMD